MGAFIVLDDNPTPQPLEAGELTHISLPTGVNTNHTVATVYPSLLHAQRFLLLGVKVLAKHPSTCWPQVTASGR